MKNNKRYLIQGFAISFFALPIFAQFIAFVGGSLFLISDLVAPVLTGSVAIFVFAFLWNGVSKWESLPTNAFVRYFPIFAVFLWNMLIFVVPFGLTGYQYADNTLNTALFFGGFPWLGAQIYFSVIGDYASYLFLQIAAYGLSVIIFHICCVRRKRDTEQLGKVSILLGLSLIVCCVCGYQFDQRGKLTLSSDYSVLKVEDEISLYQYTPFRPDNLLKEPASPPSLSIDSDYPRIDGATAAYPVYGAMVQAIYKGLDAKSVSEYVSCSKTNEAYERLLHGEIDMFFGAQPSKQQMEKASQMGIEFHLTPIAKEAFVFFVNSENPVDGLTVDQIQNIYQKDIVNWQEVGGLPEPILPFQRPEDSGSQTIMQKVMEGKKLPLPLREEYAAGMGGMVNAVAAYRNYTGAIGYSFRYFTTRMKSNESIKLLSINGVEPSIPNVRSGAYPFTVDVYVVTVKEPTGTAKALIDWILSAEGQDMIERCGYVGN